MAKQAEWVELVDRWEQSGLDAAEFARGEGLEPEQLERWQRALRAPQPRRAESRCQAARVVQLGPPAPPLPAAPAWIDNPLPDGGLVRLLPGVDASTAACVLAVAAGLASRQPGDRQTCASPPSQPAGVKK
jgi:hypothetical protein